MHLSDTDQAFETVSLMLAQTAPPAQAPSLAGQATPTTSGTGQAADGSAPQPQPPSLMLFLIPVLIFFVFITFMSSRREKKRREQLQKVSKHDRVRTRGGIIGSVVDTTDDQIVLKVDESRDTRITLDRQYIDAILDGNGGN